MWESLFKTIKEIMIAAFIIGSLWWAGQCLHRYLMTNDSNEQSSTFVFSGIGLIWIIDVCTRMNKEE